MGFFSSLFDGNYSAIKHRQERLAVINDAIAEGEWAVSTNPPYISRADIDKPVFRGGMPYGQRGAYINVHDRIDEDGLHVYYDDVTHLYEAGYRYYNGQVMCSSTYPNSYIDIDAEIDRTNRIIEDEHFGIRNRFYQNKDAWYAEKAYLEYAIGVLERGGYPESQDSWITTWQSGGYAEPVAATPVEPGVTESPKWKWRDPKEVEAEAAIRTEQIMAELRARDEERKRQKESAEIAEYEKSRENALRKCAEIYEMVGEPIRVQSDSKLMDRNLSGKPMTIDNAGFPVYTRLKFYDDFKKFYFKSEAVPLQDLIVSPQFKEIMDVRRKMNLDDDVMNYHKWLRGTRPVYGKGFDDYVEYVGKLNASSGSVEVEHDSDEPEFG